MTMIEFACWYAILSQQGERLLCLLPEMWQDFGSEEADISAEAELMGAGLPIQLMLIYPVVDISLSAGSLGTRVGAP